MNNFSNIEIINLEELEEKDNKSSIDFEQEIGLTNINNFIIDKYQSGFGESQSDILSNESLCNVSICSENNKNKNIDYSSMSNFTDQTNYSDNSKSLNSLNNSFSNMNKISNKSSSFFKKSPKSKNIINENIEGKDLNTSLFSPKLFSCNFEECEKVYKSKENLILHHKNIHLKEKPYSCNFCESHFSHRNGI